MGQKIFGRWSWIVFLLPFVMCGDHQTRISREFWPSIQGDLQEENAFTIPFDGPLPGWLMALTESIAFEQGLSPRLVKSIILTESNGNPLKVSPKGAKGLMQLMPVITKEYKVSDPHDPRANLRGGIQYLKDLLREFSGDLHLALAAYNAGPAAVRKYRGIPPFRETQEFVRKVIEIFHSGEPSPHFVPPTLRVSRGETCDRTPANSQLSRSPKSLGLFLKKLGGEGWEVQN